MHSKNNDKNLGNLTEMARRRSRGQMEISTIFFNFLSAALDITFQYFLLLVIKISLWQQVPSSPPYLQVVPEKTLKTKLFDFTWHFSSNQQQGARENSEIILFVRDWILLETRTQIIRSILNSFLAGRHIFCVSCTFGRPQQAVTIVKRDAKVK